VDGGEFLEKNGIFEEIFDFLAKKCHFSENFWDLLRFSKICSKIFLNPYPPPKIFGQAHVCKVCY
jgi:hypothetical protein